MSRSKMERSTYQHHKPRTPREPPRVQRVEGSMRVPECIINWGDPNFWHHHHKQSNHSSYQPMRKKSNELTGSSKKLIQWMPRRQVSLRNWSVSPSLSINMIMGIPINRFTDSLKTLNMWMPPWQVKGSPRTSIDREVTATTFKISSLSLQLSYLLP